MDNNIANINLLLLTTESENYWIFKIDDIRKNFLIDIINDKKDEYTIQYEVNTIQKRDFYGRVLFLFFDERLKEWAIEYEGNIENFEYPKSQENVADEINDKKKIFKISFNNINRLKEVKLIDELKYSIKSIKNFDYPEKGLRNNLNKISRIEYDAIVLGEIYYSRTVFYKLFDSLQKDHKLAFYNEIFNLSNDKANIENNCSKLLPLLEEYIERNIYQSTLLFIEAFNVLKTFNQETNMNKIGFDSLDDKQSPGVIDYLLPQIEYSQKFIESYKSMPRIEEIKNEYENFNNTEVEFYKIFKNVTFPTDLL
jgi:hypothetical protein